jgi:outer membrane autotransporter protein
VDVEGWSAGGYITYYELGRPGTGLYVDGVVKADFLDFEMAAATRAASGSTDGESLTASAEIGYGLGLGGGLVVQPQAQIAYTDLSMNAFKDAAPYGLAVSYGVAESLIGRLGVQLQANLVQPGGGSIAPYAIFNVLSEFEGANESEVAGTDFKSDVGGTWYSAGGGVTAELASNLSVYGSGEYSFGDVEGWQGTGGVKLHW